MYLNLKSLLRTIKHTKVYGIVNITGLSIGLTAFVFILLYVRYEFSYEKQHLNAERIYRINITQNRGGRKFATSHSPVPLPPAAKTRISELTETVRFYYSGKIPVAHGDIMFNEDNVVYADPAVFDVFTIEFIKGNPATALQDLHSIVLTESMARKYFKDADPIGRQLKVDNSHLFTVTAVIRDFPKNTHVTADFYLPFAFLEETYPRQRFAENWISQLPVSYILVREGSLIPDIEEKLNAILREHSTDSDHRVVRLESLPKIHLYSEVTRFSDISYIRILITVGIFILLIASINFMNLATACSAGRACETGIRKTVGADRMSLIVQFIGETVIMTLLSLLIAVFLIIILFPAFRIVSGLEIPVNSMTDPLFIFMIIGFTLLLGIISGIYPAFYLAAFQPVRVLKGEFARGRSGSRFRTALVLIQFSVTIILLIATMTIKHQLRYMQTKDLGFKKEQVIVLPIGNQQIQQEGVEAFKASLLNSPQIKAATASWTLPSQVGAYNNITWEDAPEGETMEIMQNRIDFDFIEAYQIPVIQGRNFSRDFPGDLLNYENELAGSVLINEEAARQIGWGNPIGKRLVHIYGDWRWYYEIVGMVKDFHFRPLTQEIKPLYLMVSETGLRQLSVMIDGNDTPGTIKYIEDTWKSFYPGLPFEYTFLDKQFENTYRNIVHLQSLFNIFTGVAIVIARLGLLGLSVYATERRIKEIGIRKVLGASVWVITAQLNREFLARILAANLIAWPIAWWFMNNWLQEFAYRSSLQPLTFLLAAGITAGIALLTVSLQTIKAALTDPVGALRYE
ncbi:MAG: ABC transporter permease [Candidatus Marinimicrobia bacterium]|nr:ABC transporter permease [Candidatus Neomarinimicrobiota bacterium]